MHNFRLIYNIMFLPYIFYFCVKSHLYEESRSATSTFNNTIVIFSATKRFSYSQRP